ncbi:hypothetical protein CDAR_386151 [Caerostris darwini]|uniref:Uncharacterized protein n=1 Tax=Caerostris darwini TaxID=1538125 RepID=A0AAV4SK78_9ARAC|nr:hypothetical protein CDAR_386151 [Caerostris darwini]
MTSVNPEMIHRLFQKQNNMTKATRRRISTDFSQIKLKIRASLIHLQLTSVLILFVATRQQDLSVLIGALKCSQVERATQNIRKIAARYEVFWNDS